MVIIFTRCRRGRSSVPKHAFPGAGAYFPQYRTLITPTVQTPQNSIDHVLYITLPNQTLTGRISVRAICQLYRKRYFTSSCGLLSAIHSPRVAFPSPRQRSAPRNGQSLPAAHHPASGKEPCKLQLSDTRIHPSV